jgi:uncharacterized protein with PIN domain
MFVDAWALLTILLGEADAARMTQAVEAAPHRYTRPSLFVRPSQD